VSLAVALLDRARAAGLTLEAAGDKLRVSPGDRLTPELADALRAHKAEVLAALAGPRPPRPPDPVPVPVVALDPGAFTVRVAAFRAQVAAWTTRGHPGVPLLALPGVSQVQVGQCIGCGDALPAGRTWRCAVCVAAVEAVLGLPPVRLDQEMPR
jgi:hypothetical protein